MEDLKKYKPFEMDQHLTAHGRYYAGKAGSPFYIALRDEKKIMGTPCKKCQKIFWPPRSTCTFCFSELKDTVEIGPQGTLETFTVVTYDEPIHPRKAPFVYGIVKLDRADTGMAHLIDETDFADICIGMRVQPVFADERKGNILDIKYFKPV